MTTPSPIQTTGGRRPRDLVLSLAVLLVPIGLVLLLFQYIGGDREVTVVDPAPAIAEARAAGLPVAEPGKLPDGWKPTSAVTRIKDGTVTLRIGYVSPSGGFVQLVESNADAAELLRDELGGGGRPDGVAELGGRSWQTYPGRESERALVLTEPERTVIVLGRAPDEELRELAAALR
ncbi:MAG: DUF4245 domain-containing protein [Micromonosporaceae bacterium]